VIRVTGGDLNVVEAGFANVGVNPALDQFKDLARQMRQEAKSRSATTAVSSAPLPPLPRRIDRALRSLGCPAGLQAASGLG
jgi:hypothetical protein